MHKFKVSLSLSLSRIEEKCGQLLSSESTKSEKKERFYKVDKKKYEERTNEKE